MYSPTTPISAMIMPPSSSSTEIVLAPPAGMSGFTSLRITVASANTTPATAVSQPA